MSRSHLYQVVYTDVLRSDFHGEPSVLHANTACSVLHANECKLPHPLSISPIHRGGAGSQSPVARTPLFPAVPFWPCMQHPHPGDEGERQMLSPPGSYIFPNQASTLTAKDPPFPVPCTLLTFLSTTNSFSRAVRLLISSSYLIHRKGSGQAQPLSAC